MSFQEVDRRYAELKRQHDSGALGAEAFDAELKQMMMQDDQGRWWAKSRTTGEWAYHDGATWITANPPGYAPAPVYAPPQQALRPGSSTIPSYAPPATREQPLSQGAAIAFYLLSFFFWPIGIVLYFIYRNKPFETDRQAAKVSLIVSLVTLGLSAMFCCMLSLANN